MREYLSVVTLYRSKSESSKGVQLEFFELFRKLYAAEEYTKVAKMGLYSHLRRAKMIPWKFFFPVGRLELFPLKIFYYMETLPKETRNKSWTKKAFSSVD